MAKKISDMTALAATPASDDLIPIVDTSASATKKITYSNFIGSTLLLTMFQGCLQRPKFEYSSTTAILIGAGWYEHNGTAQQMLTWDSQLTYTFGSGGSNANSDDLGASEWHYLYIDDSELSGTTMVAGEFVNTTTAPSWSETKHGFYNGNDRCVGAFLTNASSQILEFWHDGGDLFVYGFQAEDRARAAVAAGWNAYTLTLPDFGNHAAGLVSFGLYDNSGSAEYYWRPGASSASEGGYIGIGSTSYIYHDTQMVLADSSQQIDINVTAAAYLGIYTKGYYFPRGM